MLPVWVDAEGRLSDIAGTSLPMTAAMTERALNAEMDHHLAGEAGACNSRNGYGCKRVAPDTGRMLLEVPRDRHGSLDSLLIAK